MASSRVITSMSRSGIDRAARVKHRLVFERTHDVTERVHVFQLAEPLLARLRLLRAEPGASVHSISAYFVFFGLYSADSWSTRGSVTLAMPTAIVVRAADQLVVRPLR